MKIIFFLLILFSVGAKAQTVIPATLTVDSLSKLPKGGYRFFSIPKRDTVDLTKDTIPKCPAFPKQRTVIRYRYSSATRKTTFTYDDGTTTTL
jgi:hypothetical protein